MTTGNCYVRSCDDTPECVHRALQKAGTKTQSISSNRANSTKVRPGSQLTEFSILAIIGRSPTWTRGSPDIFIKLSGEPRPSGTLDGTGLCRNAVELGNRMNVFVTTT